MTPTIITSVSTRLLLLLLYTTSTLIVHAHVRLIHPTPRTDNHYLFTYDEGVCDPESTCPDFCGDPYNSETNPLTILPVGVPHTIRWEVSVDHPPELYRLSLNPTATDDNFDLSRNILTTVGNADAADDLNDEDSTGFFSTVVTIPESALDTCRSGDDGVKPCVLQLWDVYYFVSCANVLLTTEEDPSQPPTPAATTLPPTRVTTLSPTPVTTLPPTPVPTLPRAITMTLPNNPFQYEVITSPVRLRTVAYNPTGTRLATGGLDQYVRIYDMTTPPSNEDDGSVSLVLHSLKAHSGNILSVCYSPDGTKLASGSHDNTIKVWDVTNDTTGPTLLTTLEGHISVVKSVSFSPDGTKLASGSNDNRVKVWDVKNGGVLLHTLNGHSDNIRSVSWSPDGTKLASGSWDGTIVVWDWNVRSIVQRLEGHTEKVRAVVFSPDGTTLATAASDMTVILWDVTTGLQLSSSELHTSTIRDLAFNAVGDRLASGSEDKTIHVWDTSDPANIVRLNTLTGHTEEVNSVSFSPDGSKIASGGNDNAIIIWNVPDTADAPASTSTSSSTPASLPIFTLTITVLVFIAYFVI